MNHKDDEVTDQEANEMKAVCKKYDIQPYEVSDFIAYNFLKYAPTPKTARILKAVAECIESGIGERKH